MPLLRSRLKGVLKKVNWYFNRIENRPGRDKLPGFLFLVQLNNK